MHGTNGQDGHVCVCGYGSLSVCGGDDGDASKGAYRADVWSLEACFRGQWSLCA